MGTIEERLAALGVSLPNAPAPVASYRPWLIAGSLLFISGQLPVVDGRLKATGKIGEQYLTPETGQELARIAALNALAQVKQALGTLDAVHQCVRIVGYVNSAPGFTGQPQVLNGASDLLVQVFGEKGLHTRAAVGVSELPMDAPIEIEMILEIDQLRIRAARKNPEGASSRG